MVCRPPEAADRLFAHGTMECIKQRLAVVHLKSASAFLVNFVIGQFLWKIFHQFEPFEAIESTDELIGL
jgi:hypothetical protein